MATLNIQYQLQEGTGATGEPLRVNQWEVDIPFIADLPLFCNAAKLPEESVSKLTVRHFNGLAHLAGQTEISDGSVTVRDVVSPDTYQRFMDWYKLVSDSETGVIGFASEYKKRGYAYRYDSKGVLVRTFELINLWPTSMPHGDFNYDSSDGVLLEVPLSCDRILVR
jgi:hypothetical protein